MMFVCCEARLFLSSLHKSTMRTQHCSELILILSALSVWACAKVASSLLKTGRDRPASGGAGVAPSLPKTGRAHSLLHRAEFEEHSNSLQTGHDYNGQAPVMEVRPPLHRSLVPELETDVLA